jgi:hypothetical protein
LIKSHKINRPPTFHSQNMTLFCIISIRTGQTDRFIPNSPCTKCADKAWHFSRTFQMRTQILCQPENCGCEAPIIIQKEIKSELILLSQDSFSSMQERRLFRWEDRLFQAAPINEQKIPYRLSCQKIKRYPTRLLVPFPNSYQIHTFESLKFKPSYRSFSSFKSPLTVISPNLKAP